MNATRKFHIAVCLAAVCLAAAPALGARVAPDRLTRKYVRRSETRQIALLRFQAKFAAAKGDPGRAAYLRHRASRLQYRLQHRR